MHWGYLLKVYKMVRGQAQRRAQQGLVVRYKFRVRVTGGDGSAPTTFGAGSTGPSCWGPTQACVDCCRASCRGNRQARLKQ